MTLAAFIVFVVAVLAMVAIHAWLVVKVLTRQRKIDEADEGRRQAVYQQQKASQTTIAQQQRALEVLANEARALAEEARLVHGRVDAHFAHPAIKRLTNEAENG